MKQRMRFDCASNVRQGLPDTLSMRAWQTSACSTTLPIRSYPRGSYNWNSILGKSDAEPTTNRLGGIHFNSQATRKP